MTTFNLIAKEEGFEGELYFDSLGISTFGYGFTYITKDEADEILQGRIYKLTKELTDKYDWFNKLSDLRMSVIISMNFQLGVNGFSKFKKCIKAIKDEEWDKACDEMKDSRAYRQTTNRWNRQIEMFR